MENFRRVHIMNKKFRLLATSALAVLTIGASTAYALENTASTAKTDTSAVVTGDGTVREGFVDQTKPLDVPTNTEQMTKEGKVNESFADTSKTMKDGIPQSNVDYPEGVQAGTWADTSKPEGSPAQAKWKQERKQSDAKADDADVKKQETAPTEAKKAEAKKDAKRAEAVASKAGLASNQGAGSKVLPNTSAVR